MRKIVITAALAAGVSAPALAQDSQNFSGFRLEAIAGYDTTQADNDGDFSPATQDMFDDGSGNGLDGVLYGIGIGYDFPIGERAILGIEAEASDSTAGDDEVNPFGDGSSASFEAERDLYVGARAGFLVSPRTMIYGMGGYTNARFGLDADDGAGFTGDFDTTLDGFRVGGGLEFAFSDSMFANLEYRYSNYSDLQVDVDETTTNFEDFDVNTDRHQIVAGVGVRF